MENKIKFFNAKLISCFLLLFLVASCKKDNVEIPLIDPNTQPSELSKALIIDGKFFIGDAPIATSNSDAVITNSQSSASITNDNFLFVPFVFQSTSDIENVLLQIEGADNYWKIPIQPEQQNVYVLNINVPGNILEGSFRMNYRLQDQLGNIGNSAQMNVTITASENYCNGGIAFPRVEGNDGLTVKSYSFGEQPGWVSLKYDTYTVEDRIDIRYAGEWILSTGQVLNSQRTTPPIKPCNQVGNGDGFVGGEGTFRFYYDPAKGKRLDIYVSGCLEGGTKWWFEIEGCPEDLFVLGIHSNVAPSESLLTGNKGHAWISLTQNGETTFYGLWPDNHDWTQDNGSESDVRPDLEQGESKIANRYYLISEKKLDILTDFLFFQTHEWSACLNNCTSFASEAIEIMTGESLSTRDWVTAAICDTPRKLSESILEKESADSTSMLKPLKMREDNSSSCSFCL